MSGKCLTCGTRISAGQEEILVPSRDGGRARYRHARQEDCQAALNPPSPSWRRRFRRSARRHATPAPAGR